MLLSFPCFFLLSFLAKVYTKKKALFTASIFVPKLI